MKPSALAVLLILLSGAQTPRTQRDAAPPATADDPKPVRISVTVADKLGRAIAGLTAKDFQLRDDDVAQRLESADARAAQPRRVAILLDEFHVSEAAAPRVREALTAFIDHELRPEDLVVVFKPLDSLPSIRLTTDRQEMRAAIGSFEGRAGNYEPRTPLEEQTIGRSPALAESARCADRAFGDARAGHAPRRRRRALGDRADQRRVFGGRTRAFGPGASRPGYRRALREPLRRARVRTATRETSSLTPEPSDGPQSMLRRIVEETGGVVFPIADVRMV